MNTVIYDESGFPIGEAGPLLPKKSWNDMLNNQPQKEYDTKYKYKEDQIIADFHSYIDKTYGQHYMTEEQGIECFDVWLALGDSMPTFRNTAIKYLWRYGKKGGSNKEDLLKVLHYTMMMLYVDHYKKGE